VVTVPIVRLAAIGPMPTGPHCGRLYRRMLENIAADARDFQVWRIRREPTADKVNVAAENSGYKTRRRRENLPTDMTSREKEPMSTKRAEVKHYDIIDTSTLDNRVQSPTEAVMNRRRPRATIRLGSYDGSSVPLETHISKFENCAKYYKWDSVERLCYLRASIDGAAGQILWELSDDASEKDLIDLLRNRFGSQCQSERFRAELRNRCSRKDESIQSVHNDIRRLLALSFQGKSGELYEVIGRDAFLEALGP
jgi:hypothetical protein